VWIATAAFSAVDVEVEQAARSIGAGPLRAFRHVTLPLADHGTAAHPVDRLHADRRAVPEGRCAVAGWPLKSVSVDQ
jgi:hypothetical protein